MKTKNLLPVMGLLFVLLFASCTKINDSVDTSKRDKYLTQKPWRLDSINIFLPNGKRYGYVPLDSTATGSSQYFHLNNKSELVLMENKSSFNPSGTWSIGADCLSKNILEGVPNGVLNDTKMTLSCFGEIDTSDNSKPITSFEKYTFSHP